MDTHSKSKQGQESAPRHRSLLRSLFSKRDLPPLGRVLVHEGVITEEQLETALEIQKGDPRLLGLILIEQGYASEVQILQAIAREFGVSADSLSDDIRSLILASKGEGRGRMGSLRFSIRVQLSVAITFIIWMTILILSFAILVRQRDNLYRQTVRLGRVSVDYFAGDAAVALLEDDIVRLNTLIRESAHIEGLLFAAITDRDGTVKAHSDASLIGRALPPLAEEETVEEEEEGGLRHFRTRLPSGTEALVLTRSVTFSGVHLGEALVGISLDFIDGLIWRESLTVVVLSLFIVLLGIAIAIQIGVGFSRPIHQLLAATREIGRGNFRHRIREIRKDEFGDLAAAFNYMSLELWKKLKMQKTFGSYVSPEILEMILARPDEDWLKGSRMEVSLLFTDIRGFTAFSEGRAPEMVVEAVNGYFQVAAEQIQAQGGYVDKFIGDAVLGVFGAPVARGDHALRAVRAAAAMREEFRRRAGEGNPFFEKVGIGINTGEAVAGDLGSEVKREYSVIGDCVNIASRLNALAGPGQIIVSGGTLEAAGPAVEARPLGAVDIRGKTAKVEAFEVLAVRDESPGA